MTNGICLRVTALISVVIIMVCTILACAQSIPMQTTQNDESYWFVDSNGHFHTNDIKLAQEEIPFEIVVPDYIPDIFGPDFQYEITGPFENSLSIFIEVKINIFDDSHQIYISEYSQIIAMLPNDHLNPKYYDIAGIKVLQQEEYLYSDEVIIEGRLFFWNQNGLTFEVRNFGINEDESIRVVKSIIE